MAEFARTMVRGTAIIFITTLVGSLLGYFVRLLLARNLTPTEFGLFYAVFAFISFFAAFKGLGISTAVAKFVAEYRVKSDWQGVRNVRMYYLVIESIVYLVMFAAFLFFAQFAAAAYFGDASAPSLLVILSIAFAFSLFESLAIASFHGYNDIPSYGLMQVVRNALVLISAWGLLSAGFGVQAPAYAYAAGYAGLSVFSWMRYRRLFPHRVTVTWDRSLLKRMALFGLPTAFGQGAASALSNVDTLIITSFRSLAEVGVYNTVLPTSNLVRSLFRSAATVLFPISCERHALQDGTFGKSITVVYRYTFALALPMAIGLMMLSNEIISIFFGADYAVGALALSILAVGTVFSIMFTIATNVLVGVGAVVSNSAILIIGSVVLVLGDLALVPFFGIDGAALANTVSQGVIMVGMLRSVRMQVKAAVPVSSWSRVILAGLTIPAVVIGVRSLALPNLITLGASVLLGGLAYTITAWILRVVTIRELAALFKATFRKKQTRA